MLLTTLSTLNYNDALDTLNRMKRENKINENTLEFFSLLYAKELDILRTQGYFNPSSN